MDGNNFTIKNRFYIIFILIIINLQAKSLDGEKNNSIQIYLLNLLYYI